MRKLLITIPIVILILQAACGDGTFESQQNVDADKKPTGSYLAGSYLVFFKKPAGSLSLTNRNFRADLRRNQSSLRSDWESQAAIKEIHFISSLYIQDDPLPETTEVTKSFFSLDPHQNIKAVREPMSGILARVEFTSDEDAQPVIEDWERSGRVWFVERNGYSELSNVWKPQKEAYQAVVGQVNWIENVRLLESFSALETLKPVPDDRPIIAVMDSGVDIKHPAFIQGDIKQYWENTAVGQAGCGFDDLHGCNTTIMKKGLLGNGDVFPNTTSGFGEPCPAGGGTDTKSCDHGTKIASAIVGLPSSGAIGSCPICKIMVVRIVGPNPDNPGSSGILDSSIANGLKYVSSFQQGSPVRIINASFGKFDRSRSVAALVESMRTLSGGKGPLLIGAAGNEDTNLLQFPAAFPSAIAVAAIDSQESNYKAPTSNFGQWVDIAAPGVNIPGAQPGGSGVDLVSGTSIAAPLVSGVAGLVLAAHPELSNAALRSAIIESANPNLYSSDLNGNYLIYIPEKGLRIPMLGSGLLDAEKAVKLEKAQLQPSSLTLNRVTTGCGTIGNDPANKSPYFRHFALVFLLLPLMLIWGIRLIAFLHFRKSRCD